MIWLVLYLLTVAVAWIPMAMGLIHLVLDDLNMEPETTDYILGTILGLIVATVWPVVLFVLSMSRVVKHFYQGEHAHAKD